MRRELKIGIFLAGTFLILGLLIFIVGDMSTWFRKSGYELDAYFQSATGLEKQAAVRMAGVRIGYVKDIRLAKRRADVVMSIFPQYQVPKESKAALASIGLIGEKYIEINPSDLAENYAPGGVLETTPAISFDQLGALVMTIGDEFKKVGESLNNMTSEESKNHIHATLQNLNAFTADLKDFMAANKSDLQAGVQGIARASRDLDQQIATLSKSLDQTIETIHGMAQENRGAVKSDIEKVGVVLDDLKESVRILRKSLEKIDKGEGTVGKLVQDPELYETAKTTLASVDRLVEPVSSVRPIGSFRLDYLADSEQAKSVATLGLSFSQRYLVIGQVVQDPFLDKLTYSAEGGMRWNAVAARAGIIESTFGAGVDLITLGDRLTFSLEGYDFYRDIGPRFRFITQFSLVRYLHLVAGVDDFGQSANRQFYFGLGLGIR
jgi:phospholipid/cholesterol/gamma-HCH transport system substrate-binding protein